MAAYRSIAGIARRNGKVLVAKRKEGGAIGLMWEFPGGKVEEGESDEDALKREFLEEFGIEILPKRLLGTSRFFYRKGECELAAWEIEIPGCCGLELREHTQVEWVGRAALDSMDLADSDRALLPLIMSLDD